MRSLLLPLLDGLSPARFSVMNEPEPLVLLKNDPVGRSCSVFGRAPFAIAVLVTAPGVACQQMRSIGFQFIKQVIFNNIPSYHKRLCIKKMFGTPMSVVALPECPVSTLSGCPRAVSQTAKVRSLDPEIRSPCPATKERQETGPACPSKTMDGLHLGESVTQISANIIICRSCEVCEKAVTALLDNLPNITNQSNHNPLSYCKTCK